MSYFANGRLSFSALLPNSTHVHGDASRRILVGSEGAVLGILRGVIAVLVTYPYR